MSVGLPLLSSLGYSPYVPSFPDELREPLWTRPAPRSRGPMSNCSWRAGKGPSSRVKTSADGSYHFIGVRPADYDLSVQAKGFLTATLRNLTVDAARETDVPQIKLQLASVTQTVEVVAESAGVETSSAEISGTISMADIRSLPILDRDPLGSHPDAAGRRVERQLDHRDQRTAHVLLQRDAGRHQHSGQLHPRQCARLHARISCCSDRSGR